MDNVRISVLTPTYNRGSMLKILWESLKKQSYQNFEWIIVSDGSNDNTDEIVVDMKEKSEFEIKYIRKENGGKPSAHNAGICIAESDITVICDDDDYFTDDALECIASIWQKVEDETIGGMIGYRGRDASTTLGNKKFSQDFVDANINDIFREGVFDTTQIYRTNILKNNLFPVTDGEKFIPEIWLWKKIDKEYKLRIVHQILEICEYLEDGLTKSKSQTMWNNPMGYSYYFQQKYDELDGWERIKYYGVYRGLRMAAHSSLDENVNLLESVLSLPVAFYIYWKQKYFMRKR